MNSLLSNRFRFDTFIRGNSNLHAHSAAIKISNYPGVYNPLYIYGDAGIGKTHLAQATAHHIQKANDNISLMHIEPLDFYSEFTYALENNMVSELQEKYLSNDLLIFKNIQSYENKINMQCALFYLIKKIINKKKQIIITANKLPYDLNNFDNEIVAYLKNGLLIEIKAPDLPLRVKYIHYKSRETGSKIDPEVIDVAANKISSSMRALESAVLKLNAFRDFYGNDLTISKAIECIKVFFDE